MEQKRRMSMKNELKGKVAVIGLALVVGALRVEGGDLRISGSSFLEKGVVEALADAYRKHHPETKITLKAGHTASGVKALVKGNADIAVAGRRLSVEDRQLASGNRADLRPTLIGYHPIAMIVHPGNPVKTLTRRDILAIYTGGISDWSFVGGSKDPIHAYAVSGGSESGKLAKESRNFVNVSVSADSEPVGPASCLQKSVLGSAAFSSDVRKVKDEGVLCQRVAEDPDAIGFVTYPKSVPGDVKVVAVNGVAPTKREIQSHRYKLVQPILFYTNGQPRGEARQFLDFCLSQEGQAILAKAGLIGIR
jgi:phosphate transport system substrate-binding protein